MIDLYEELLLFLSLRYYIIKAKFSISTLLKKYFVYRNKLKVKSNDYSQHKNYTHCATHTLLLLE